MVAKKKGAGGSLTRSQVVTVRLDPKLKFAAELAAKKQRRTLSSFIEWAIEETLKTIKITSETNMDQVMAQVWDVEEADRFVKLASNFPELLNYEEEKLWKLISECHGFWGSNYDQSGKNIKSVIIDLLRYNWETLLKIVSGEATMDDISELPKKRSTTLKYQKCDNDKK